MSNNRAERGIKYMHDIQEVQEQKNKKPEEKPFNIAELHEAAFGRRGKRTRYYELDEDDDADCYCD